MKKLIAITLALVGCSAPGSARIVEANAQGGEIVLEGRYMDRVAEAVRLMAVHCDGDFAVIDEMGERLHLDAPSRDQTHAEFVCTDRAVAEN